MLARGVGTMTKCLLEAGGRRFPRCIQNAAVGVEQPAVITTPQSPFRDNSVFERRAAMGTVTVQYTNGSRPIAVGNQVLAQNAD